MSTSLSHLYCLQTKSRRERLEWLGDAVMEEAVARLMAREALAALRRQEAGVEEFGVTAAIQRLSQCCGEVLGLVVSNANLSVVYGSELSGFAASLGLGQERQEDGHLRGAAIRGRLCSSNVSPVTGLACDTTSPKGKRQKCRPDLVESAIGEAFEASLLLRVERGKSGEIADGSAQRFAGEHRASLVDRLISAALSTDNLLDYLRSEVTSSGRAWHQHQQQRESDHQAAFRNQFDALDDSEEEEEEEKGDGKRRKDVRAPRESRPLDEASHKPSVFHANVHLRQNVGIADEERGGLEEAAKVVCAENADAGRETVLRSYGAALLRFRVSVYLFCSVPGGSVVEQGPGELTMRRQKVMCTENLEAVALHLQSIGIGSSGADSRLCSRADAALPHQRVEDGKLSTGSVGVAPRSPSKWLRVAVGSAALLSDGSQASFSTRVAALLLSRSGERGQRPSCPAPEESINSGDTESPPLSRMTVRKGGVPTGRSAAVATDCRNKKPDGSVNFSFDGLAETTLAGSPTAAALAEAQFSLNPWPDKYLPKAREQATKMFSPRPPQARRPPFCHGKRSASEGGAAEGNDIGSYVTVYDEANDIDDLQRARRPRRKRKREAEMESDRRRQRGFSRAVSAGTEVGGMSDCSSPSTGMPPHYTSLVGSLPLDQRRLLARLGHHGYVKVLESLLDRFVRHASCPSARPDKEMVNNAKQSLDGGIKILRAGEVGLPTTGGTAGTEKEKTETKHCPNEDGMRSAILNLQHRELRHDCAASVEPWHVLGTSKSHPSLCGLVEPLDLARAEPDRLVLPIPSPFYRRVLHALCSVHGLCSQGGEVVDTRDTRTLPGTGAAGLGGRAGKRHRTVEVRRGIAHIRCVKDTVRAGEGQGGVAAGVLVPVEILLSGD